MVCAAHVRAAERRLYLVVGSTTASCDRTSAHGASSSQAGRPSARPQCVLGAAAGSLALVTADGQGRDSVQSIGYSMPQCELYGHFPLTRPLPFAAVSAAERIQRSMGRALMGRYPSHVWLKTITPMR
jgi:hypothetical protein